MALFYSNSPREVVFIMVAISPFLYNFVIAMLLEMALSICENSGIDVFPHRKMTDMEYAVAVVLLSEDPSKFEVFIDRLNNNVYRFGVRFATSKSKVLSL